VHLQNRQNKSLEEEEEKSGFVQGLVLKLEKEKHQGNLEDFLVT
jgi:hypothetical protein